MKRRLRDDPVQVEIHDASPIRFRWDESEYEVITLLKMLSLVRPSDGVDTQLWQVRARSGDEPASTFELECDHGRWRLAALWYATGTGPG